MQQGHPVGQQRRNGHKRGGGPGWRSNYPNEQTVKHKDVQPKAVDSWWLRPALQADRTAFMRYADARSALNLNSGVTVNSHGTLDMD